MTNRLLETLQGSLPKAGPPIWFMRQAGRYLPEYRALRSQHGTFLDLCFSPEAACEITLQPIRRFGFDAAIIFSDILVIPWGLGQDVSFAEGKGPVLPPLENETQLKMLKLAGMTKTLAPVYEAIALTKARLNAETALIGFAGSPWTLATYMLEGGSSRTFSQTLSWAYQRPDAFQALLDLLAEAVIEHLEFQIQAGAQAVQLFDSWAGAVPDPLFSQCVLNPAGRIVQTLNARHPAIPVIGFAKGAGVRLQQYGETGMQALGIDSMTPLPWAIRQAGGKVTQGNLDPFLLAAGGPLLDQAVDAILQQTHGKAHIFNLGHGILPHTPIAHVERVLQRVRNG
jgi:uroporphyrinogen decarboxylase